MGEDDLIRTHYPDHGPTWSRWRDLLPGRSKDAISIRAHRLGITMVSPRERRERWSARDDVLLLRAMRGVMEDTGHSADEIQKRLRVLEERAHPRARRWQ